MKIACLFFLKLLKCVVARRYDQSDCFSTIAKVYLF